jgi:hypothetical protein
MKLALLKAVEGFDCGYVGKECRACYLDLRGVYLILSCGHPLIIKSCHIKEYLGIELGECPYCGYWAYIVGKEYCLNRKCISRKMCEVQCEPMAKAKKKRKKKMANGTNGTGAGVNPAAGATNPAPIAEPAASAVPVDQVLNGLDLGLESKPSASASASVTIGGHEDAVDQLRIKKAFLALLKHEVEEIEDEVRRVARLVCDTNRTQGEVVPQSVRFVGTDGMAISVTIPNENLEGNRRVIKDDLIRNALRRGVDLMTMGVTQEIKTVALSGKWLEIVDQIVARYEAANVAVPEGMKRKSVVKLTPDGIARLRDCRDNSALEGQERDAYNLVLSNGLTAGAVKVE